MAKIPEIFVDLKANTAEFEKDMRKAKQIASESAKGISTALNGTLSSTQVSKGTNSLINSLGNLNKASKVSSQAFKQLGVDLGSLQRVTGVTGAQFQALQSKMLATAGAKAQEKALRDIARAADLTEKEIRELGSQFGLSKSQIAGVIGTTSKATGAFGALGTAIKTSLAFLSVGVLASWGAGIVRVADQYTLLESRLRLVTTGSKNLAEIEEKLYQISLRTHQSQTDTVDLYTRMARATKQLGTSQADLLTITESINQALIVSGASATESSAALIQLSQGLASGVLRGEEFNSVMEQTPRLAQAIADGLGVSIGKLRDMSKEGELTAEVVTKALLSQKDAIAKEYSQMSVTVSQAFQDLRTVIEGIVDDTNDASGATSGVVSAVQDLTRTIDANKETIANVFAGLIEGAGLAVSAVGQVYRSIGALGIVAASRDKSLWDWITADGEDIQGWFKDIGDGTAFLAEKLDELKDKRQEVAESWAFTSEARKQKQADLAAIDEEIAGINRQITARRAAASEQVKTQATITQSVQQASAVVVAESEKENKAYQRKIDEQKRIAEEMTDMIKTSVMSQTEIELYELEKRKAAHMEAAKGNIQLQRTVTEAYAAEQNRLTMLIEAGVDKRTAAERESLEQMKDGWLTFNEGKAEAAKRSGEEIQQAEQETTTVFIDEWSNALESVQSSLADMIYEFDFSMDSILDIFKRMLAEMLAAIAMSGIKDALVGMFKFEGGKSLFGGLIDGFKSLLTGDGEGGGGGILGALGITGAAKSLMGLLGIGGTATAGAAATGLGFVAGTGAGVGGAAATVAAGGTASGGGILSSLFGGGGATAGLSALGPAIAGITAIVGALALFGDRAPTIGEQLNVMNVSARQLIDAGLTEEFQALDASVKNLIPALDRATGASFNAATGILQTGSEIYAMAEAASMGSETLLRMNYQLNESTGAWEASATVISKWQQEMYGAADAANSVANAVGQMGSATAAAAGKISGAANDIASILNGARQTALVGISEGGASYHADGGIFTRTTRIGNDIFGESGPEAIVPLHDGRDSLKYMADDIKQIKNQQPVIRIYFNDPRLADLIRVEADRLDADRDPLARGRRYVG